MSSQAKPEDTGVYHLLVGTEVSAKYRGAFCEAQIKLVKKDVVFKVINKKNGKCSNLGEEGLRGVLKVGSVVEAQFPEQNIWQEATIQSAKDKSVYTVVFDDGDERTLSRGSLCLKGDRHYAKSETLDNLPLTDPENFGTPVLSNKKSRSRRRPVQEEYDDESEDQKTPDQASKQKERKEQNGEENEEQEEESSEEEEEDDDEKRKRWLADPIMGKVVIVEPNDKRKHWFPGLVVNPLCYEGHQVQFGRQLIVRSFKTGKFCRVSRKKVKEMTNSTIPTRVDREWNEIVQSAQEWKETRTVPEQWKMDIKDILSDSEEEESSEDESDKKKSKEESKKSEKKNDTKDSKEKEEEKRQKHDFLEILYKFMEDRGTPINKTPVLGYKDLNLHLLYRLVQKRDGSSAIATIKEWKQIYMDLGIPKPNPAAGYNVKTAYMKYLGSFEEYCVSWKDVPLPKKLRRSRSPAQATAPEEKKKSFGGKRKDDQKTIKKEDVNKDSQEGRKIKTKERRDSVKSKSSESGDVKTRGRSSPIDHFIDDIPQLRRSGSRRRISESSSASDLMSSKKEKESKHVAKGGSKSKIEVKQEENARNPGGPDSEPDEGLRSKPTDRKESGEKKSNIELLNMDNIFMSRRIRRNSTSNLSTQYVQGNKLKVKYGHGKTFKLYDAKILQVKPPENPGDVTEYLVHYAGWNSRHDELIKPNRIVGLIEERSPAPPSPSASSKSFPRRPKTPNTGFSKHNLLTSTVSMHDIAPSPRVSTQLNLSRFPYPDEKTNSNSSTKKNNTPSIEQLKKNLSEDFAKSTSDPNIELSASSEPKRPVSPVLLGSQRLKRSKSPPQTPATLLPPPVTSALQSLFEKEAALTEKAESPRESEESSIIKVEKEPEVNVDQVKMEGEVPPEDVEKNNPEEEEKEEVEEDTEKAVTEKPEEPPADLDAEDTKMEIIKEKVEEPQEEEEVEEESNMEVAKEDSMLEEDDTNDNPEENENIAQSNIPTQLLRRTSGRRSKSPAYLSDSSLYGLTKRRRYSSSAENSPSPTAALTGIVDTVPEENDGGQDNSSTGSDGLKRSPSPSLSISSSSSAGSGRMDSKEKSPVLCSASPALSKNSTTEPKPNKGRKRGRNKSGMEKADEDKNKAAEESEAKKEKVSEDVQTSEYDNFDEEAPSIALEKPKKSVQIPSKEEDPVSSGPTEENPSDDPTDKTKKEDASSTTTTTQEKSSTEKQGDSKLITKRKIRKRRSVAKNPLSESNTNHPEPNLPKDVQDPPKITDQLPKEEDKKNKQEDQDARPTRRAARRHWDPTPEEDPVIPDPHENIYPAPSPPHDLPADPPSSSKVLLDNTPPTTPEHSPPYISEDQDNESGKHSPLDSDMMDIGDEQKDSSSTTSSSSSSSSCSSQEFEKSDAKGQVETEETLKKNELENAEMDEELPTPSKKTRRGRSKRRRTTSKGSRGSYNTNEQDTESEEDDDDETGESNRRKRNESGSRCKPRKKRAKARPEPPSAPPPLHCEDLASMTQDDRITLLQSRMAEMRQVYHQLKQEVANIDRKRKRAKRREREAAEATHSAGKRGMSPFTPTKVTPINGKAESGISTPTSINKQAVSNGDSR